MYKNFNIQVDIKNSNGAKYTEVVQGDTGTVLNISILDSYVPIDLTGLTLKAIINKADGTTVFQDSTSGLLITDAPKGLVELKLKANSVSAVGNTRTEIVLFSGADRITSEVFNFYVRASLDTGNVPVSTSEVVTVTQYLANTDTTINTKLSAIDTTSSNTINTRLAQIDTTVNNAELARKTEFDTIKSDYNTYKDVMIAESNVAALQSQINNNSSALADKAKQIDVTNLTSRVTNIETNKRDISVKITNLDLDASTDTNKIKLLNLSDEVKQAMAGTTSINASVADGSLGTTKYADESVTTNKLDGYKIMQNLFNVNKITLNYLPNTTTGNLDSNTGYAISDFIKIDPNTTYFLSYCHRVVFYDANKTFISGVNNPSSIDSIAKNGMAVTSPATAVYVRFGLSINLNGNWSGVQFSKGSSGLPFEPYRVKVKNLESDSLIDASNSTMTVTYDSNGKVSQTTETKDGKQIITVFTYTNNLLSKIEKTCDGVKTTETINRDSKGIFTGTTKTVTVL